MTGAFSVFTLRHLPGAAALKEGLPCTRRANQGQPAAIPGPFVAYEDQCICVFGPSRTRENGAAQAGGFISSSGCN